MLRWLWSEIGARDSGFFIHVGVCVIYVCVMHVYACMCVYRGER